jgi:diguanylate cyclase (GGDEF)-like protein
MSPSAAIHKRVVLVDIDKRAGDELLSALNHAGVVASLAPSLDQAARMVREVNPSVIVMLDSKSLPLEDAAAFLIRIKANGGHRQTVILTDHDDARFVVNSLSTRGVDHVFPANTDPEVISAHLVSIARTAELMGELVAANLNLSKSSKTDALTGLYNHGHILEWLSTEHKRATRNLETLACVMIDIDYFKMVNDTYGHGFGDRVLRETADLLRRRLRDSDVVGRYGGEEFLVLAPKTNAAGAKRLAEKLRASIEQHVFEDDVFEVRITASFGVATSDHTAATSAEMLLQISDRALLEAKELGRNRVVVAPSEGGSERHLVTEDESTGGTVLIIDHSPLMVEMLGSVVRSMGLNALEAHDGPQALELIRATHPDCLLLDINTPGMDGFHICRQVKSMLRDMHVPVIFVTEEKGLDSMLRAYDSGADDYITKPVTREHLIAKIQAQLRVKALHDRLREANAKLKQAHRTLMRAERLQAVSEMAGGVAHDFNNLIGSVLGHSQFLQTRTSDADMLHGLAAIEQLARDGADTIRRLHAFASPGSTAEPNCVVDIAGILEDCLKVTRTRWKNEAQRRGITYEVDASLESGTNVRANATELRELFTNLIVNALEAMPRGGALHVRCGARTSTEVIAEIRDSGVGIPHELIGQIFDPFVTTKAESGTGLGLSVAYGIVNRMRGRIDVESKPGNGATFCVTLPSVQSVSEEAPETDGAESSNGNGGSSPESVSILVIDDEPHVREVFSEILADKGYQVFTEPDGESGLEHFRRAPTTIVLTDLGMPGISGWEVIRQVKSSNPEVGVILTSGWGGEMESDDPEKDRVDAVLPKPVSLRALLDCVESLLRKLESSAEGVAEGETAAEVGQEETDPAIGTGH